MVAANPAGMWRQAAALAWSRTGNSWAFQPPREASLPAVSDQRWPQRRLDHFVFARLDCAGLSPSAPADRRTWLRRVTFDLTGLPPTPDQVDAFLADDSPGAFERVVERLLASPHYGERWARVWLDVARYAEDQAHIVGNDQSLTYPNAFLYRDWVIRALNDDMPYDRFVRLQLAADLIEPQSRQHEAALGFLGLGPKYYARRSIAVMADEWEDRIDVVGRGLLGLTVACARCHDHKYDPVPTEDYYALAGVFASTEMFNRPLDDSRARQDDGQAKQPKDALHVVRDATKPADLNVFVRGNAENPGPVARRRFLRVLSHGEPPPFQQGSGRRELAEAIASPFNPLTARVIVNRVWAEHFGRALVATTSNFGALGAAPSHPELLDDLAVRFMQAGWSLKWLHRELVLSATYRQSSAAASRTLAADPDNRLLGRMSRRRLSVEQWRDAWLSVAGRLDSTIGGPSIEPQDPSERRRTVYSRVSRLQLDRMLALFDFPDANLHCDRRAETTTPLQKMFLTNGPFAIAVAESLAGRLAGEIGAERADADWLRIQRAYELLYARPPGESELWIGLRFLRKSDDPAAAWPQYAHALLAANEAWFID
jgi:hypothetical protein